MNKNFNPLKGIAAAWDLLLDYPWPFHAWELEKANGVETGAGIPLLGLIAGMAVWFIATTVSTVFNPLAGSAVFVVLGLTVLEFKDSGRGIKMITTMILQRLNSPYAPESMGEFFLAPLPTAIWFLLLVIKGFLLLALGLYGGMGWLGAVIAGGFGIQGVLAASGDEPLLESPAETAKGLWWCLGIIGFIYLCCYPLAAILGGIVFWFICREERRKNTKFNAYSVSLAGAVSEWVWLATGLLAAIKIG